MREGGVEYFFKSQNHREFVLPFNAWRYLSGEMEMEEFCWELERRKRKEF